MTRLSVLFCIIAIFVVWVCTRLDSIYLSLLLPILVILLYVLCVWRFCSGNSDKFSLLGDQVYFLGYLSTITALGALLWRIAGDQAILEKPDHVILLGGIALTNIVVSLICMMALKSHAQSLDVNVGIDVKELEAFFEKLRKSMEGSAFLPTLNSLVTTLQVSFDNIAQLATKSKEATNTVDALSKSVLKLSESITALDTTVTKTAPNAKIFARSVVEVEQVLDQFIQLVKRKLDSEIEREREGGS